MNNWTVAWSSEFFHYLYSNGSRIPKAQVKKAAEMKEYYNISSIKILKPFYLSFREKESQPRILHSLQVNIFQLGTPVRIS